MEIKGKLISLVEVSESHLELMVKWRNDPEISKYLFDQSEYTIEKQKIWFEKIKNDNTRFQFIILENKNNRAIGAVNLMNVDYRNLNADWGYYIGEKEFKMGGYAVEAEFLILKFAFEELKLNKVYCQTLSENTKVISNHTKFGFKIEGILREHYKRGDTFFNVTFQSILKKEFEEVRINIEKLINYFNR